MRLFYGRREMRKLAIASVAFAAAIFAANYILPDVYLIPLAAVFALIGVALLFLHRKWLRSFILTTLALALGLSYFWIYACFTTRQARALDGETREISAVVLTMPQDYDSYARAEVRVSVEGAPRLRAVLYDTSGVLLEARAGDTLTATALLKAADTRFGESYDYYNARDIYLIVSTREEVSLARYGGFSLTGFAARLNHELAQRVERLFPADTALYFKSLMLGDRSDFYQDDALYLAMSHAGFMHIVAVSGMHVAFFVSMLQMLMGVNRRSSLLCLALVWLFVLVTGCSPSAVRAAFMQTTLLLAPLLRRENDPITSLFAALALILLLNPYAAASVSLQLSFAAIAGLMLFAARLSGAVRARLPKRMPRRLKMYLAATVANSLSALVFTLPLTAHYFGYVALLSPIGNVLALWTVPICFGGGYAACAIANILPWLSHAAAWLLSWLARYLFTVAKMVSAVDFSVVYMRDTLNVWWLVLVYVLFLLALHSKAKKTVKILLPSLLAALTLGAALTAANAYYKSGSGYMSVMNVGQGQSLTVFSGESTVVIDCGSINAADNAGNVTGTYLKSCRRDCVDVLLLTHLHADHANGVIRLMEYLPVKTLIMPLDPNDDDNLLDSLLAAAAKHRTEVVYISEDTSMQIGNITMELYAPGKSGDANERCVMTKISVGDYDMLVTGDGNKATERELLDNHDIRDVELLIVGHHGSRYSSSGELLANIGAETAVISVGYNNYGHPTQETLERLDAYGYNIYRTDLNGDVEIRIA